MQWLREHGRDFSTYEELWRWSVTEIEAFWESIFQFCAVRTHAPYSQVLDWRVMPGAKWFSGATLNYAEHALASAATEAATELALICQSELRARSEVSWRQLARNVGALAVTLRRFGVVPGDRVVSYMPNIEESITALLATANVGAIWSACSPDMGTVSVLDRFRQIKPKVLFAVDGYRYGGKDFDRREIVRELVRELPSVEALISVAYLDRNAHARDVAPADREKFAAIDYVAAIADAREPEFTAVPFDHPLWVVYSSGTTGMPKPIVHGHGGTIIENLKATMLHSDLARGDRYFWFTSTSWIMWNSLANALMAGATVLLFDGNPGYPDLNTLWRFVANERATVFGLSPAFVNLCVKAGIEPRANFDLSALRTVGATGSPLTADGFRWIYEHVHDDVMLSCISGGTDPGAAFLGSCPILPVYAGEMPCRALGLAVYAYDDAGQPVTGKVGELVVAQPFPSMPLYFWGDVDGKRYFDSYFDVYPNVWRHGDWLELRERPESVTGIIYGRSDSTINRHGIRMGTSELYRVVEEFPELFDALVIDLEYLGRESYLALFVVLRTQVAVDPGAAGAASARSAASVTGVEAELRARVMSALKSKLSARHMPNEIFAIAEVPRTLSGKKLEVPIKKILLGLPLERSVNRDSMANPRSLDWFIEFARARAAALV
jgi:acetoacetyl-CoA synthetase